MLRRVQSVLLMGAVAAVFFCFGAKVETWIERPASAGIVAAAKMPVKPSAMPVLQSIETVPAPAMAPETSVETGVDPESNLEYYKVKDMPEVEGAGQDVDMIDDPVTADPAPDKEPAAEADAPPPAG